MLGLICSLGAAVLTSACKSAQEGPTNAELWEQFYESQLDTMDILDEAFDTLGQEYYRLDIEYESIGRSDLARMARRKAKAYHEQHLAIQRRITDLRHVNARVARGESPIGMEIERVETEAPETPAPSVTPQPIARATPKPLPQATPRPLAPAGRTAPPAPVGQARRAPAPTPVPLAPQLQR